MQGRGGGIKRAVRMSPSVPEFSRIMKTSDLNSLSTQQPCLISYSCLQATTGRKGLQWIAPKLCVYQENTNTQPFEGAQPTVSLVLLLPFTPELRCVVKDQKGPHTHS